MGFTVVIPARYASTRFPGKPLAIINGKAMIQHVYERALESDAHKIIIATDDERIMATCTAFCSDVVMTSQTHENGTSRIAEVIEKYALDEDEIIINVQGDEPFIPYQNINQLARLLLDNPTVPMSTLCHAIDNEEDIFNPNVVKVVIDNQKQALYFSRSAIPYPREYIDAGRLTQPLSLLPFNFYRHIGIYGYRASFVTTYKQMSPSPLSVHESLEQLRVLEHGFKIVIEPSQVAPPHGVDTPEDLARLIT